ncbi:MAG TPA: hypothetical protein PLK77_06770 [Pyrinomonadaceae bacterium]|nr:hypothetical protein [Pyrinomonadaceae bacterium]
MNIEELELSLRTEFEGQVRNVLAGIKNEVAEFQTKFQTELEEHRNKLDQAVSELSTRLPESSSFDAAFNESVNEHLRLARDDGAQVAATAFGEAEKLRIEPATTVGGFDLMRDAIAEISSKHTQATILQALVEQASQFAARGAFFIVKNDHFVGWKIFGSDAHSDEGVRDVLFAASTDTILASSVASMAKVSASEAYSEDHIFLDALNFGRPAEMHAIPLTARGRGVAVLYADAGSNGGGLNVEALETLVRVAGLTVELLAASQTAAAAQPAPAVEEPVQETVPQPAETFEAVAVETAAAPVEERVEEYSMPVVEETVAEPAQEVAAPAHEPVEEFVAEAEEYTGEVTYEFESNAVETVEVPTVEAPEIETFQPVAEVTSEPEAVADFAFSSNESYDASYESPDVPEHVDVPVVEAPVAASLNGNGHVATIAEPVTEPIVEVAASEPKKSRFSDRNVDLPIEVADDERKLHNDARRFARLLVSEIKLYNEQKVSEGREAGNLYEQLKEAIDRSREMYDKRVQPAVASKFDYFHYEVVNSLADGQDTRLGTGYPGATV